MDLPLVGGEMQKCLCPQPQLLSIVLYQYNVSPFSPLHKICDQGFNPNLAYLGGVLQLSRHG